MASLQFAVVILVLEHVHFGLFCPGAELLCQRLRWQRTPGTVSPGRAAADTAVLLECIHFGSVFDADLLLLIHSGVAALSDAIKVPLPVQCGPDHLSSPSGRPGSSPASYAEEPDLFPTPDPHYVKKYYFPVRELERELAFDMKGEDNTLLKVQSENPSEESFTAYYHKDAKSLKYFCSVAYQVSDLKRMLQLVLGVTAKGGAIYQCVALRVGDSQLEQVFSGEIHAERGCQLVSKGEELVFEVQ
ncbi:Heparan-sulfate 6-O-sulfotransferase 1 [Anas platyrhynchos]|uniref:Heparan-sulfate 6-O-sulfotransferase 1 n=1 Tax=Anas platyrhynchos TaxID=8839 RepID=R0KLU1_ANAPL|nr:Heparan-sulfate 6-O-sulfotransferase 1 [Anas platyrhynchos]